MATTHILAVGKMSKGSTHLRVTPPTDSVQAAVSFGRRLHGAGASRWACLNQHEQASWDEADYEASMVKIMEQDAAALAPLQDYLDAAAELEDLIEGRLDNEFWAGGSW